MALESADHIGNLNPDNPPGTDFVLEGDNHLRMVKQVLLNQFPQTGELSAPASGYAHATEPPTDPDPIDSTDELLWSPAALAAWITANWDALKGTPTVTDLSFHVSFSNENTPGNQIQLAVSQTVPFDTVKFAGGTWDPAGYKWTPGEAGKYLLYYNLVGDPNDSDNDLQGFSIIQTLGGSSIEQGICRDRRVSNQPTQHGTSTLVEVAPGDEATSFELRNRENTYRGIYDSRAGSYFGGYKVGSIAPDTP